MKILAIIPILFYSLISFSQDKITKEDYDRAVSYMYKNVHNKTAFHLYTPVNWFADSSGFWFVKHAPNVKQYRQVSLADYKQRPFFDHQKVADLLGDTLNIEIKENELPIQDITYTSSDSLLLKVKGKDFHLNSNTYTFYTPKSKDEQVNEKESVSPNKNWTAYTKNHNLWLRSTDNQKETALSYDGESKYAYASWYGWGDIMEGENGKRPDHFYVNWSKDSKWLHVNICDLRNANKMYLLDWSVDTLYRPKLLSYYRGSPGDTNMVYVEPVFFNTKTGKRIKPKDTRGTHINSTSVVWSELPDQVYLIKQDRGYQNISIRTLNLATEEMATIYTESSTTNIDNFHYEFAEEYKHMFFLSEKSGWRQLYSLDLEAKKEKALGQGSYYIHSIEKIDLKSKKIYFLASGKESGVNPYYQLLYSISIDGSNLTLLTPEPVHHRVNLAPDGKHFVDNYSTVETPTKTVLRELQTGKLVKELTKANVDDLNNWTPPSIFSARARDEKTTLYGAIWKPSNFDESQKYPVIELSYTGPHTQVFPTDFSRSIGLQSYAELGFVVLVVDGLGSSGRSKAFHNYSYKNLGGNLEDHVGAILQLGRKHPWIDTTRVGIFGHSAGGYDAGHALLAYPDFYKVGVASSADHDHRMEKAWWPEMYMGWPVDSSYHKQSNITMAGKLKGKLLITHGGIDENVNPSATFKLAEALIQADKQFDMLILPSQRHGYRGKHQKYFNKLRWNYFVEHLRGVEPIWDFDQE